MLKEAQELKDIVKWYCRAQNLDVISEDQWRLLSHLLQILGLFDDITRKVSSSEPTITQSLQIYFVMYLLFANMEILVHDGNKSKIRNKQLQKLDKSCSRFKIKNKMTDVI